MSYVSISTELVALLNTISDLNIVYDYEPKEIEKYPAATVVPVGHNDVFIDTHHNNRVYSFMIRFYFRTEDASNAESVLRSIIDTVISLIEADVTLNGSVNLARPTDSTWVWQERELPVRVVEMTISAEIRILR